MLAEMLRVLEEVNWSTTLSDIMQCTMVSGTTYRTRSNFCIHLPYVRVVIVSKTGLTMGL